MKHFISTAASRQHIIIGMYAYHKLQFQNRYHCTSTFSCTKVLYTAPYHFLYLLLLVQHTFILYISPIVPKHCCVTMDCIRVESRLAKGLNVWSRTLVEVNDWQPISLVQGGSSPSTISGDDQRTRQPLIAAETASRPWTFFKGEGHANP